MVSSKHKAGSRTASARSDPAASASMSHITTSLATGPPSLQLPDGQLPYSFCVRSLRRRLWKALVNENADLVQRLYQANAQDFIQMLEEEIQMEWHHYKEQIQQAAIAQQERAAMLLSEKQSKRRSRPFESLRSRKSTLHTNNGANIMASAAPFTSRVLMCIPDPHAEEIPSAEQAATNPSQSSIAKDVDEWPKMDVGQSMLEFAFTPSEQFCADDFRSPYDPYNIIEEDPEDEEAAEQQRQQRQADERRRQRRKTRRRRLKQQLRSSRGPRMAIRALLESSHRNDPYAADQAERRATGDDENNNGDNQSDADADAKDNNNDLDEHWTTPLHEAARLGSGPLLQWLLERPVDEADPNIKNGRGRTILHMTAGGRTQAETLLEELTSENKRGEDKTTKPKDDTGNDPESASSDMQHAILPGIGIPPIPPPLAGLQGASGKHKKSRSVSGKAARAVSKMFKSMRRSSKSRMSVRDSDETETDFGGTLDDPLELAFVAPFMDAGNQNRSLSSKEQASIQLDKLRSDRMEAVVALISWKPISAPSAVAAACSSDDHDDDHPEQESTFLSNFYGNGSSPPSVNAVDRYGRTALHYAAETGRSDVCWALLSSTVGVLLTIVDNIGARTPCELAAMNGHPGLAAQLEARAVLYTDSYGLEDEWGEMDEDGEYAFDAISNDYYYSPMNGQRGQSTAEVLARKRKKLASPYCWFSTLDMDQVDSERQKRLEKARRHIYTYVFKKHQQDAKRDALLQTVNPPEPVNQQEVSPTPEKVAAKPQRILATAGIGVPVEDDESVASVDSKTDESDENKSDMDKKPAAKPTLKTPPGQDPDAVVENAEAKAPSTDDTKSAPSHSASDVPDGSNSIPPDSKHGDNLDIKPGEQKAQAAAVDDKIDGSGDVIIDKSDESSESVSLKQEQQQTSDAVDSDENTSQDANNVANEPGSLGNGEDASNNDYPSEGAENTDLPTGSAKPDSEASSLKDATGASRSESLALSEDIVPEIAVDESESDEVVAVVVSNQINEAESYDAAEAPTMNDGKEKMYDDVMITDNTSPAMKTLDKLQSAHVEQFMSFHKWKNDAARDAFKRDLFDAFGNANITLPDIEKLAAPTNNDEQGMCMICCDDEIDSVEWFQMQGCTHGFCKPCLQDYLSSCASAKATGLSITCPHHECNSFISAEEMSSLLDEHLDEYSRLVEATNEKFVTSAFDMRFCPHPGCDGIVRRLPQGIFNSLGNDYNLLDYLGAVCTAPAADISGITTVTYEGVIDSEYTNCRSMENPRKAHRFCFACSESIHWPVPCDRLEKWKAKVHEQIGDDDEKSGDDGHINDIAQKLWIKANTRPCPRCSVPIEKNDGCNHMTCSNPSCNHEFCWICKKDWRQHGTATGGFFRCNIWSEDEEGAEENPEDPPTTTQARPNDQGFINGDNNDQGFGTAIHAARAAYKKKREMDRFLHHYTRWNAHAESAALERHMGDTTCIRLAPVVEAAVQFDGNSHFNFGGNGLSFVHSAFAELLECRSVLQHSYPFSYFRYPSFIMIRRYGQLSQIRREKAFFEKLQSELETMTEQMSDIVARSHLRASQFQIKFLTKGAAEKRQEFSNLMLSIMLEERKEERADQLNLSAADAARDTAQARGNSTMAPSPNAQLVQRMADDILRSMGGVHPTTEQIREALRLNHFVLSNNNGAQPREATLDVHTNDAAQSSATQMWACTACTYMNSDGGRRCAVCGTSRAVPF